MTQKAMTNDSLKFKGLNRMQGDSAAINKYPYKQFVQKRAHKLPACKPVMATKALIAAAAISITYFKASKA